MESAVGDTSFGVRATLVEVIRALEAEGIAHAFIGALPVLAWGRVRATTDLDLVVMVADDDWHRLREALTGLGITQRRQVGPSDRADSLPDIAVLYSAGDPGVRIDLFIAKTDFERVVVGTAREAPVFGALVRLARPEASIVYKLLAYRPREIDDVESIFESRRVAGENLDWTFLEDWSEAWGISERLERYRATYGPS